MTPSYSVKCRDYWTFGAGYKQYVIGFVFSFPSALVKFPWIKQCLANVLVHTDMYFCHISHRFTRPHRHFLASAMTHLYRLVHTDIFFRLLRPIQVNQSTWTFTFHWHSPHRFALLHRRLWRHLKATKLFRWVRAHSCPQGHLFHPT